MFDVKPKANKRDCAFGWNGDLSPVLNRIAGLATGGSSLKVIHAGSRLALALPRNKESAVLVTELYQPQRWKGRVFKGLAKGLVASGLAGRFPNFSGGETVPLVEWLRPAATAGSVGFLGCNPVHGWRCVLGGIDPMGGVPFVAKLGLGESASSIRREGELLRSLHGRFAGVVEALSLDEADSKETGEDDWALLRLPYLGCENLGSVADVRVSKLLSAWLMKEEVVLGADAWVASLLARVPKASAPENWHRDIGAMRARRALVHGDFAVWNLRVGDGVIHALDWEWAVEQGVGGIDLAHALRQEAVMVRGLGNNEAIDWMLSASCEPHWADYLKAAGWSEHPRDWLRLGLLHSHFHTKNDSAGLLKAIGIKVSSYA